MENASAPVRIDAGDLPWGYGENRITAIVRDPDSVFLYWEMTDEGIAAARLRLGAAGATGSFHLRVYDTTGHVFDGTNARDYFDIQVDRGARDYFLMIRRPGSSLHAEIGVKSHEGYFQPVARSGRADFPRKSPSPSTSLEWMTVESGHLPPAAAPFRSRYPGGEPALPAPAASPGNVDVWQASDPPSHAEPGHPVRVLEEWVERREWRLAEWQAEWRGPLRFTRWGRPGPAPATHTEMEWHDGPVPLGPVEWERVVVEVSGEPPVERWLAGSMVTSSGPWRVTVHGLETGPRRRVLSTWIVRRVVASTPMIVRWGGGLERLWRGGHAWQSVVLGASEQHALLELGASEAWRQGASERLWLGASEWWMGGASETVAMGSSFWAYAGASEWTGGSAWMGASPTGARASGQGFMRNEASERWATRPVVRGED